MLRVHLGVIAEGRVGQGREEPVVLPVGHAVGVDTGAENAGSKLRSVWRGTVTPGKWFGRAGRTQSREDRGLRRPSSRGKRRAAGLETHVAVPGAVKRSLRPETGPGCCTGRSPFPPPTDLDVPGFFYVGSTGLPQTKRPSAGNRRRALVRGRRGPARLGRYSDYSARAEMRGRALFVVRGSVASAPLAGFAARTPRADTRPRRLR